VGGAALARKRTVAIDASPEPAPSADRAGRRLWDDLTCAEHSRLIRPQGLLTIHLLDAIGYNYELQ
jgi:hypothetical protein